MIRPAAARACARRLLESVSDGEPVSELAVSLAATIIVKDVARDEKEQEVECQDAER